MIITNGKIITWSKPNEILEGKAILIKGQVINKIDSKEDRKSVV
mgnify:CR=1 FL=1